MLLWLAWSVPAQADIDPGPNGGPWRSPSARPTPLSPVASPAASPAASSAPRPSESPAPTLTVQVSGVSSDRGQITALLYRGEAGFPAKEALALRRVSVRASPGSVTLRFAGVAPGSYAVTVYHDENGNGKLDSNWIGIPKEPVAVSNNAKGRMGPPKYKDAMFTVGNEDKSLPISLIKI